MRTSTAFVAITAFTALLGITAACDTPSDEPDAPAPVVTTAAPSPGVTVPSMDVTTAPTKPDPSASISRAPGDLPPKGENSPSGEASNASQDPGLVACQDIIKNVQGGKLPLPINEDAAYYKVVKDKFTASGYTNVKKAGEDFVDKYASAVNKGGADADANSLSNAATDLVKACQTPKLDEDAKR